MGCMLALSSYLLLFSKIQGVENWIGRESMSEYVNRV